MCLQKHLCEQGKTFTGIVKMKIHVGNCFNSIAREINLTSFSKKGQSCLLKQADKTDFWISAEPLKTADNLHKG